MSGRNIEELTASLHVFAMGQVDVGEIEAARFWDRSGPIFKARSIARVEFLLDELLTRAPSPETRAWLERLMA